MAPTNIIRFVFYPFLMLDCTQRVRITQEMCEDAVAVDFDKGRPDKAKICFRLWCDDELEPFAVAGAACAVALALACVRS